MGAPAFGYYALAVMNVLILVGKVIERQPGWLAASINLATLAVLFWAMGSGRLVWSDQ